MTNKEDLTNEEVMDEVESNTEDSKSKKKDRKSRRKNKGVSEEQLVELEMENQELKDKYLRLHAEFDNYKKRTVRESLELRRTAARDTLSALLDVLDDFDRAKANADNDDSEEHFSDGVAMVYNKLYSKLSGLGLQPMVSTHEDFDPDLHEAITKIPAPTEELNGKVVDTIEKGYYLNDTIIRHAKVVVGE